MESSKYKELVFVYKNFCKKLINLNFMYINETTKDISPYQVEFNKLLSLLKKEFKGVDFRKFNIDDLKDFGFSFWDENLILAPIWVIEVCDEDIVFTSISNEKSTKKNIDKDTRFGVTAWGFTKSEIRDSKLSDILK